MKRVAIPLRDPYNWGPSNECSCTLVARQGTTATRISTYLCMCLKGENRVWSLTCFTCMISLVTRPSKIVPSIKNTAISNPLALSRPTSRVVSTSCPRWTWLSSTATNRTRWVQEGIVKIDNSDKQSQLLDTAKTAHGQLFIIQIRARNYGYKSYNRLRECGTSIFCGCPAEMNAMSHEFEHRSELRRQER